MSKPKVWYLLKQDVLWYKTGTAFGYDDDGGVWIAEPDDKTIRTLDSLQVAIASHIKDEGSEEYFLRLEL